MVNPYHPQVGYGNVQYPLAPPANLFYAPPAGAQQYNGYPTAHYQSFYRRPSDSGHEPPQQPPSRRQKTSRRPDDEVTRVSRPTKSRNAAMRPGIAPDFLFISLSSHDVLKIANITSPALLDDLRNSLQSVWPQGIATESEYNNEWIAKLGGDVWSAGGRHGIMARRLVCRLFSILAEEGFGYQATVDSHPMKSPRMVFASVPPDPEPYYFMLSFSLNRRTLTIIDAPQDLAIRLGAALRGTDTAPSSNAMANARWVGHGVYEVVTGVRGSGRQDIPTLMGSVLKMVAAEGFRLEASVPFGKAGLFGLRGRREVWMFRSVSVPKPLPNLPRGDPRKRRG